MSLHDDVHREALHDWLNERDALRADEQPDPSEYDERYYNELADAHAAADGEWRLELDE